MSAFVPSAFAGHRLPVSTSCVRGSGQSDDKAHDTLSEKRKQPGRSIERTAAAA